MTNNELTHEEKRAVLEAAGYRMRTFHSQLYDEDLHEFEHPSRILENWAHNTEAEAIDAAWAHDEPRRLRARIAALEAQLAARKQADDMVDALIDADQWLGAWDKLPKTPWQFVEVYNALQGVAKAARIARAAREQAVRDAE